MSLTEAASAPSPLGAEATPTDERMALVLELTGRLRGNYGGEAIGDNERAALALVLELSAEAARDARRTLELLAQLAEFATQLSAMVEQGGLGALLGMLGGKR